MSGKFSGAQVPLGKHNRPLLVTVMYNQYTFSYILSLIDMTLVSRQMSLICLKAQYYNKPSDMEKVKVTTIINIRMVIYITMYTYSLSK